jgi:hypothetical protein
MTISNQDARTGPYSGNGATTSFAYDFKVIDEDHLVVTLKNSSNVETVQTITTNYTVTGVGANGGGTVEMVVAPASGETLTISRAVPLTQEVDLANRGGVQPEVLETAYDKLTQSVQDQAELFGRIPRFPVSSSLTDIELPLTLTANAVLTVNSAGTAFTNGPTSAQISSAQSYATAAEAALDEFTDLYLGAKASDPTLDNDGNALQDGALYFDTTLNVMKVYDLGTTTWKRTTPTTGDQANIDAVTGIAADVTTVATNVTDVTNFADVYIGPSASDPTQRADTSALQAGDLYFNTTVNELRAYSGSQWVAGTAGTVAVQRFNGDGSTVAFTLATAPAGENNTQVYISGVYQQKDTYSVSGTTVTLSSAPPTGTNNIEIVTISTLALGETDASLVTYTPAGTGAVERTVQSVLRESVSVKDFGAVGDGSTDDTTAINAALDASTSVYFPAGTYIISAALTPLANTTISGAGMYATVVKVAASAAATISAISLSNVGNLTFRDFTIDGNKAARSGSATGNNITVLSSNNKFLNIKCINAPNAGFIVDGQTYTADLNEFRGCVISSNGGVGLSQHTARNSNISQCEFSSNGLENLTIDNTSHSCIVDGNRFFKHLGGCGNIGWDDGDNSILSNNFIDNESDTTASVGNRNGICVNAQAGITTLSSITGNTILNCVEYGIYLRDRSGTGGYSTGTAIITSNSITGCGDALRVGNGAGPVLVKNNIMDDGIVIDDTDTDDVRFGAGEIAFHYTMSGNQTISTPSSGAETTVDFDTAQLARFVTNNGSGDVTLPVGGIYNFNVKIRIGSLGAGTNIDTISIGVNLPSGATRWLNFDNDVAGTDEVSLSFNELVGAGTVKVRIRFFGASTSSESPVIQSSASETFFSAVLLG